MIRRILVSACLLGQRVRYDGHAKSLLDERLSQWSAAGRVVALCPEVSAGLPTPRPPMEIARGQDGGDVLEGRAHVLDTTGADVTSFFLAGADNAVKLARDNGCAYALLADGSPACGSTFIFDGSFVGKRQDGSGVTAARLRAAGIAVYADHAIEDLARRIADDDAEADLGSGIAGSLGPLR